MSWVHVSTVALLVWIGMAAVMTGAWLIQQRSGNSGWVDVSWTFGLGGLATLLALWPTGETVTVTTSWRALLIALLVVIWGARLGLYIAGRTQAISDDPRYRHLQEGWGDASARNMFWLLQAQALLSVPLGVSIVLAAHNPAPLWRWLDFIGLGLFIVGFAGSAVADRQLKSFKQNTQASHAVCDVGLWSWSRHPNYFFESVVWLSYPLFAINLAGDYPMGYFALAGPVCIYWLLTRVSGIPPLEAHMIRKYGQTYEQYRAKTSPFFPLPPNN